MISGITLQRGSVWFISNDLLPTKPPWLTGSKTHQIKRLIWILSPMGKGATHLFADQMTIVTDIYWLLFWLVILGTEYSLVLDTQVDTFIFAPFAVLYEVKDMHFFFKRKVSFVFPHFFPFYTTDQQTFSTHFDSHVIVQYKGEANCISESKTSRFS